ncbi:SAM-dependent methyltransferase [Streptomyces sp. SBT349]|uniref:SAM-dependent methyltransferase n=1 Tax=Streptomyces sp. SBT349 TaxID=1580539 RepID=UPI00066A70D1|nr:SAM-dependent methyltransferase [Streptomyces sp. SBT349]
MPDFFNPDQPSPEIDISVHHSARVWNYLLGGKDNYEVDRTAGDRLAAAFPGMVALTRHSRAFIGRVVRHLTEEEGIRQFLDIGTGLPTVDNTHEVAQSIAPESRVVYVDNDPLVLVHATALLTSTPQGACDYVHADARDPERILHEAARTLDFSRPVGLMLMGILGLIEDDDEARSIVTRLTDALAPGSFLGLNDGTTTDPAYVNGLSKLNKRPGAIPYTPRSPQQISRYFDGLDLLEPGVISVSRWRLGALPFGLPEEVAGYGGLARKPAQPR